MKPDERFVLALAGIRAADRILVKAANSADADYQAEAVTAVRSELVRAAKILTTTKEET